MTGPNSTQKEHKMPEDEIKISLTVKGIVAGFLKDSVFDGLWCPDADCACALDDLMPCDSFVIGCCPGYKQKCDCGEHDWHIGTEKE